MILCHKCSGTFESHPFLEGCRCISGYPRGIETDLSEGEALEAQISARKADLKLYRGQSRAEEGQHVQGALFSIQRLREAREGHNKRPHITLCQHWQGN